MHRRAHKRLGPTLLALYLVTQAGCTRSNQQTAPEPGPRRGPVLDFHTHISPQAIDAAAVIFDQAGITQVVNLSARPWGPEYGEFLGACSRSPIPMIAFTGVDWRRVNEPNFGEVAAEALRQAVAAGARGLKISKVLGLVVEKEDGSLLGVDDPRLDPLWKAAGQLGVPVAIHTGDPLAFFQLVDETNERIAELRAHPGWSFHGPKYPTLPELMAQRDRMVSRHPQTTFVAVHVGGFPEDLDSVARSLEAHPNLWVDLAARIPEIGRQEPAKVRDFFERFQDRILMGSDLQVGTRRIILGSSGDTERPSLRDAVKYYDVHWRYLETNDVDIEHMTPIQGEWTLKGIGLPRSILRKIYWENGQRLLGV